VVISARQTAAVTGGELSAIDHPANAWCRETSKSETARADQRCGPFHLGDAGPVKDPFKGRAYVARP
jgi:hypothetical protein